jgi:hypothetical protein
MCTLGADSYEQRVRPSTSAVSWIQNYNATRSVLGPPSDERVLPSYRSLVAVDGCFTKEAI